ncbi:hypothetical protein D3C79_673460 [compost metagenome]
MQAMAGIDDQALGQTKGHTIGDALELFSNLGRGLSIRITASVQFDRWGTHAA